MKNWRTFIDPELNMGYNGIAYEIKRLGQRGLLVGSLWQSPGHQDVGTS